MPVPPMAAGAARGHSGLEHSGAEPDRSVLLDGLDAEPVLTEGGVVYTADGGGS